MKTLFYFSAPSCENCQVLNPTMEVVSRKGIAVEKINTDYELDRAKQAGIRSIPTVVLAENGQEIKRFTGIKSVEQIMNWLNS